MKARISFVSNSSSSSFLIPGWPSLPKEKKEMVLDYCLHALAAWKSKDIPVTFEHNCWHIDDTMPLPETMSKEQLSWLDFGWLEESGWRMRENDDGQLELTTLVDNFDMGRWLDYLGIDHTDLGESFGLFPGEEIEFDEEPINKKTIDE